MLKVFRDLCVELRKVSYKDVAPVDHYFSLCNIYRDFLRQVHSSLEYHGEIDYKIEDVFSCKVKRNFNMSDDVDYDLSDYSFKDILKSVIYISSVCAYGLMPMTVEDEQYKVCEILRKKIFDIAMGSKITFGYSPVQERITDIFDKEKTVDEQLESYGKKQTPSNVRVGGGGHHYEKYDDLEYFEPPVYRLIKMNKNVEDYVGYNYETNRITIDGVGALDLSSYEVDGSHIGLKNDLGNIKWLSDDFLYLVLDKLLYVGRFSMKKGKSITYSYPEEEMYVEEVARQIMLGLKSIYSDKGKISIGDVRWYFSAVKKDNLLAPLM